MLDEYIVVKNLLDKKICEKFFLRIKDRESQKKFHYDDQCLISPAFDSLLDDLADYLKDIIAEKIKQPLWSTYNYCRIYKPGEFLAPHKDKNQCEIAVSLTLNYEGDKTWPIWIYSNQTQECVKIELEIGDILIYKGFEVLHWRNKFTENVEQVQAFFFYATDDRFADPFFPGIEKLIKRDYEWLL